MSEESVILLEDISSSQADTKSVVRTAVSHSPFDVPEEKVAGKRGEESPVRGPEGPIEVGSVCETEAGTEAGMEADVEDEDEDVNVVGGVDEVGWLLYFFAFRLYLQRGLCLCFHQIVAKGGIFPMIFLFNFLFG